MTTNKQITFDLWTPDNHNHRIRLVLMSDGRVTWDEGGVLLSTAFTSSHDAQELAHQLNRKWFRDLCNNIISGTFGQDKIWLEQQLQNLAEDIPKVWDAGDWISGDVENCVAEAIQAGSLKLWAQAEAEEANAVLIMGDLIEAIKPHIVEALEEAAGALEDCEDEDEEECQELIGRRAALQALLGAQ